MQLTTLCYIQKDDCYLMLHRTKKKIDPNKGKWLGIGGHFEENESPEECAVREVREETGLVLDEFRFRGVVTFVSNLWEGEQMFLFTSNRFHGELQECSEGDLDWVSKKDIMALHLWEGDRIFLKLLLADEPVFNLKLTYEGDTLVEAVRDGVIPICVQ